MTSPKQAVSGKHFGNTVRGPGPARSCSRRGWMHLVSVGVVLTGCGSHPTQPVAEKPKPVEYFHVDPATAGAITGRIEFHGAKVKPRKIDTNSDAGCPQTVYEDTVVTGKNGGLANAFVYIQSGLEGKRFEPPHEAVVLDQHGCTFVPRVIGVQAGQMLGVKNSDNVSHNIHPMPTNNREWNQQQAPGTPDLEHKFPRADVMIPVKCNVHSWMRAYIGVLEHPYFAVTSANGEFSFANVPPGDYTVAAWHEKLGELKQQVHLSASGKATVNFTYP